MRNYQNSLCWDCANFSKCTWSRGKAVDGWTAKKVIIKNGDCADFRTYFVEDCPHYERDKIFKATYNEIAAVLGETLRYVQNALHRRGNELEKRLMEKGYRLRRYEGCCYWWLERLD